MKYKVVKVKHALYYEYSDVNRNWQRGGLLIRGVLYAPAGSNPAIRAKLYIH